MTLGSARTRTNPQPPQDVPGEIRRIKRRLREQLGDPEGVFRRVEERLAGRVGKIEALRGAGRPVWLEIHYDDIAAGTVAEADIEALRDRGCLVVRGHIPEQQARAWDEALVGYLDDNDFDSIYRGPGDDFFGTLASSRPEIYPIYWSRPQMEARQHPRMAAVQSFLNRRWSYESEGKLWFDPDQDALYPDRVRRRPPGTTSSGLGAHTDSGALERWLLPAYQRVFRHVFAGEPEKYDPWDAAYRPDVDEYEGGTTMCSMFRTFQGWTALCDMQNDQGVLHTVPIPEAMVYVLLRALQDDVPEDELCGVALRQVLPISEEWHAPLMRALTPIPDVRAGDSVWWHCDMVHAVAAVENQKGWGNVMYIPAAPMCDRNAAYAALVARDLASGRSPRDFPEEHYEVDWTGRFTEADLNDIGRRGLTLTA